jgi:hypothetical protein
MGSTKRSKRESKRQTYEFILQWLRYAIANRIHLIRVTAIRSPEESVVSEDFPSTEVVIRLLRFPEKGPLTPKAVACFLESWPLQQEFLAWCGKQVAEKMTAHSRAMKKLRSGLMNLKVGRAGKLPPRTILLTRYKRLVGEFKALHDEFPYFAKLLSDAEREAILEFGRKNSTEWIALVTQGKIGLKQIAKVSPESAAKLSLSEIYGCSDESIHSRLFRKGSE